MSHQRLHIRDNPSARYAAPAPKNRLTRRHSGKSTFQRELVE